MSERASVPDALAAPRPRSRTVSASRWDDAVHTPSKPLPAPDAVRPWDEYTLIRRLGRGSFGQVYEARHAPTGQVVAIKQIHLESTQDEATQGTQTQDLSEIQREISSLAQCASCERVTRYYGSFLKRYTLWVIMELMDAGSCLSLLRRVGPLPENVVAVVCRELVLGLAYLHDQGIIHRDIKAANVLLSHTGQVKLGTLSSLTLADFGVAAQLLHRGSRRNTLVGTPYWMAPEVIKQSHYDARADIWSLGITALELATGHPPLSSYHPMRALFLIPKANVPQVDTSDGKHSEAFAAFVAQCLAKRPEDRASAHTLAHTHFVQQAGGRELVQALLGEHTAPRPNEELSVDPVDGSVLDTSSVSEWVFDLSNEGGLGVNLGPAAAPAAAALADVLQPEAAASAANSAATPLLQPPSPQAAPPVLATPPVPPPESTATPAPIALRPTTPRTPPSPETQSARTTRAAGTPLSSPSRTPRAQASPRMRRTESAQTRVQAALEKLAYQAGQDAAAADTPTTQLYQLHGLLSQMGRLNPEYLEQFVELLCAPHVPAVAPATASRLAGHLYERWLEGLRARWQVLDTGGGPT